MRRAPVLLLALIGLAAPQVAWAHGEFRPDRVPRSATARLDLVLPSEREGARTVRVVLAMPEGFTARDCEEPVGWTCAVAADAVEWRDVAMVRAETDFLLTVTTSSKAGTYTLPVEQTYDDGTVAVFAGQPGTPDEAPVLTVTGAAAGATSAAPRPTVSRSATARPTVTRTSEPTTSASATGSARPTPTVTAGSSASSSPGATTAPEATAFARPSSLPRGALVGGAQVSSGGLAVKLLAGALVVLVGAAVVARRRPNSHDHQDISTIA